MAQWYISGVLLTSPKLERRRIVGYMAQFQPNADSVSI